MPPTGGMWATQGLRVLNKNLATTTKMLRTKLAVFARPLNAELQPVAVRANTTGRQPVHPAAWLRQQKRTARWHSSAGSCISAARRYLSTSAANATKVPSFVRSSFPTSNTGRAVAQLTGRAPFASTLRPNLTGGALPRTAGGYAAPGVGRFGAARYFSHTPTAPAQVVQNVSQAMRAFLVGGQRARYDGVGPNGQPRYRAVSVAQEEARLRAEHTPRNAPGAYVDFRISPVVTALSPLGVTFPFATAEGFGLAVKPETGAATLNTEGFLDVLSVDFARALKDLAAVMNDLKRIAEQLGDLPVSLEKSKTNATVVRVRFPGVDADTVERLCDEVGVSRGFVSQDPEFEAFAGADVALKFPYAPDEARAKTITSPGGSMRSHNSELSDLEEEEAFFEEFENNPWASSANQDGYESMSPPWFGSSGEHCSEDFEGLEGIYRFLEECDHARDQFRQPTRT